MNKYIIPVCNIDNNDIWIEVIYATSIEDCQDKFMERYSDYASSTDWEEFLTDLFVDSDTIVGTIKDIEEL